MTESHSGFWLIGVRLADGRRADVEIADARINAIGTAEGPSPRLESGGRLCLPSLVEGHVHVDKTFLGCPWQPHLPGTSVADRIRLEKVARARVEATPEARGGRLVERSIASGAGYLRTHIDIDPAWGLRNLDAALKIRSRFANEIDIQIVAFPQSGILRAPGTAELMDEALRLGADLVGGLDPAGIDEDPVRHLDIVFELAGRHGKGVDIHLHDGGDLGCYQLRLVAERTKALGLEGRVAVSHAFCLAEIDEWGFSVTAEALARADVAILTSVPSGSMPPVKRLGQAGVTVFAGSDNIRDAWAPHGNADILERATFAAHRQDMRSDADLALAFDLVSASGAKALGVSDYGIRQGAVADLLLVDAENVAETVAGRPQGRVVFKRGRIVAGAL